MNIALKQIRVFVTVAQERTITAAADKLCLSKPAVSMALAELEKQLGHKVFDRNNNRLLINEYGLQLLPIADELLTRSRIIEEIFLNANELKGNLKIGSSDTIGNQITPYLVRDFRIHSGHQDQSITIANSDHIAQSLLEFELDVGLIEGRVQHDDLILIPWQTDDMVIALPKDHPLTEFDELTNVQLDHQTWILRENGSGTRNFFFNHVAPYLNDWRIAFDLNTTESILNAVSANLGVSCLSRLATQWAVQQGRIVTRPLQSTPPRQYWLAYHKEKYQSPLLKAFLAFCQEWQLPR